MMAGLTSDLDVLKEIPGYKAILKSVLKSQIQLLIEQLSDHTGEETIILTASIHDGTLSHLGSNTGKGFLNGRDEIKSQFLGFCLKSHHKKKTSESRSSPYQRPLSGGPGDRTTPQGMPQRRPRIQPVSLQRAGISDTLGVLQPVSLQRAGISDTPGGLQPVSLQRAGISDTPGGLQPVSLQRAGTSDSPGGSGFAPPTIHRAPSQTFNTSTNGQDNTINSDVKLEQSAPATDSTDFVTTGVSFPTYLQLSHTQTSADQGTSDISEVQNDDEFTEHDSENEDSAATSIKIEPITENEMELEITGVEPGKKPVLSDSWNQGPGTSGIGDSDSIDEGGDQSGYRGWKPAMSCVADEDKENVFSSKNISELELFGFRFSKVSSDGSHNRRIEFTKREALSKNTREQGRFELRIPERRSTNGWNNNRDAFTEIEARNPLHERQICTFIKSEPKDADSEPLIAPAPIDRSSTYPEKEHQKNASFIWKNNIAEAQVNEMDTQFVKSKPLEQYRCATNVDTSSSNRE